ncbi:hypothetical protein J9303_20085 [Bacillaceae bacterium Marseille-Q3522]|nr:hypothetical protein [Bacillaceae bacterium Marseille-Q3522]
MEAGEHVFPALRVDHSGIALKLIMKQNYLCFMLKSISADLIHDGSVKLIALN